MLTVKKAEADKQLAIVSAENEKVGTEKAGGANVYNLKTVHS